MASTVEGYLADLRKALAGTDPAVVQDAVYDAEEYLRSAVAESDGTPAGIEAAIASAVEAFGAPEEVANAYRTAERTVARALRKPAPAPANTVLGRFFRVLGDASAWGAFFYMLLTLVTGTIYFTLVVTGLSMTAGLAVLIIGIPFALLFIAVVRAISLAEGRIVEGLLGVRMPRRPRTTGTTGNLWDRIKSWFADYRTWTTMLYMLLMLPLGVTYFTIMVVGVSICFAFIAAPFAQMIWHFPIMVFHDYHYVMQWWAMPFFVLIGIIGFVVMLWLAKGVGILHSAFAKIMLVGRLDESEIAYPEAAAGAPGSVPAPAVHVPDVAPAPAAAAPATTTTQGGAE